MPPNKVFVSHRIATDFLDHMSASYKINKATYKPPEIDDEEAVLAGILKRK